MNVQDESKKIIYKKVIENEDLYNISPSCTRSFFTGDQHHLWRALFLSLFISIVVYYTSFEITFSQIFSVALSSIDVQFALIAIIVTIGTFVSVFIIASKLRSFKTTYAILIIMIGSLLTLSGVSLYFTTYIPNVEWGDIITIFVVLFPSNFILSVLCFYITRKIVCRLPESKQTNDNTENFYTK